MVKVIGLTGGIASGKSTVTNMLQEKGFTVIDADVAARKVVEVGEQAYHQIINEFGEQILQSDLSIDRAKLGAVIFHDESKRKQLNTIVHPAVRREMLLQKENAEQAGKNTVFMDIPLLYESKLTWMVEKVMVVYVDQDTQLKRLMERNDLSEEEAQARIRSQLPLSVKAERADIVIDNNETIEKTKDQVEEILMKWGLDP
ncbi:dephospho-CoA kinase [Bacillus pakistanensis]|uniref:Dephospho-CoA kinase n=1 Tax=Rossellomorea pakistanensis TaxID=992288 RepID=A0ABS2NAN0_9BACI|nr:dephospho-CoA kinase [Bacillus pakistanensis]MBM7584917.1 dephospho-CoA kinase [Bacillus pakistanensis]